MRLQFIRHVHLLKHKKSAIDHRPACHFFLSEKNDGVKREWKSFSKSITDSSLTGVYQHATLAHATLSLLCLALSHWLYQFYPLRGLFAAQSKPWRTFTRLSPLRWRR
jgi:hypothetical protein